MGRGGLTGVDHDENEHGPPVHLLGQRRQRGSGSDRDEQAQFPRGCGQVRRKPAEDVGGLVEREDQLPCDDVGADPVRAVFERR